MIGACIENGAMMYDVTNFEKILEEHENMIYYLMKKYGIRDPEKEFYQEATIALWKAADTYDDSRGKFSSYAYFKIEMALLGLIRKNNRQTERERERVCHEHFYCIKSCDNYDGAQF